MDSQAADITDLHDHVTRQLPLDREIVLLDIRPDGMGRDRDHAQGKSQPGTAGILISDVVVLVRSLHHRRCALQELGVALVAVGVLEEDAIASAYRQFAITKDVISKTYTRRRVE